VSPIAAIPSASHIQPAGTERGVTPGPAGATARRPLHIATPEQGEHVTHWAAVAATIEEHMTRLGLDQTQLARRSAVSVSIVRELQYNTVQRRRDGRILQALSTALELHPRHLAAIATGHPPPGRNDPVGSTDRLTRIENRISEIAAQVDAINGHISELIDLVTRHPPRRD
jgi:hypothetical protein